MMEGCGCKDAREMCRLASWWDYGRADWIADRHVNGARALHGAVLIKASTTEVAKKNVSENPDKR